MMPTLNGYEATRIIRNPPQPDTKTVPIPAMSVNAFQDDILKSRSAGMDEHPAKPLSPETLMAALPGT